jgi:multidrug resistance efflux pump
MQAVIRVLLTLVLLVAASLLGYDMVTYYLYSPWTRDARTSNVRLHPRHRLRLS